MSDATAAHADRRYHLLIVDDDEVDRRSYARLLARRAPGRFRISHAGHGAAGLALLAGETPDCVLLDYSLPDMDGLEFLTAAARDGALPCAVVLVTGHGNEAVAVETMKRGVLDYLVKDRLNENGLYRAITNAVTQNELRGRLDRSLRDLTAANAALQQQVASREAAEVELRAAKEAAEQANAAKTRFVALVSHELRTPLNGVLGYAELLRLEGGLAPKQDARVGAMMLAGRHLLGMIEQLLDFAGIEAGRMTLDPQPLAVRTIGKPCLALVEPMAREHGLRLRLVRGADAPKRLVTDVARLRQMILNLLGNAVKYTPSGSVTLRLLAGASPGGLRVEVADTGPGIPPAQRARLFHDFERLATATSVEGAGLGLAIAARIVALMGGRIGHAPNPGGGSIFWLEVPSAAITPAPRRRPRRLALGPASLRLLLVDDNAMNRDVIGAFLAAAGHAVVPAADGVAAVRLAIADRFDLILMDVRMPGMDGLEATRRIRALPGPRGRVPILALTAFAVPEQIARCRQAGMDGHVTKPVDQARLLQAIAAALAAAGPGCAASAPAAVAAVLAAPVAAPAPAPAAAPDPASVVAPDGSPAVPPRLDRSVLDQTLTFLPQTDIAASLQALRDRHAVIQRLLARRTAPQKVAEAAHQLAALAGMFGFAALSTIACRYERVATGHATPDDGSVDDVTRQLREENRAALALLDGYIAERRLLPA